MSEGSEYGILLCSKDKQVGVRFVGCCFGARLLVRAAMNACTGYVYIILIPLSRLHVHIIYTSTAVCVYF